MSCFHLVTAKGRHMSLACKGPQCPGIAEPLLQVASTVSWFRTENQYYQACTNQREPGKACNKKLQQNDDGW